MFDVLVGINLLREGLDLPEVSLVSILDADKEGFLRSGTSLIQTIGRAARNVSGQVHMYADTVTDSMAKAIDETNRRRAKQVAYNEAHGVDPMPLRKRISDITELLAREDADTEELLGGGGRQQSRGKAPVPGLSSNGRGRHAAGARRAAGGRPGRPDPAAHRPDARGRRRAAVRARRPAARRDRRAEEGAARHARGGHGLSAAAAPARREPARRVGASRRRDQTGTHSWRGVFLRGARRHHGRGPRRDPAWPGLRMRLSTCWAEETSGHLDHAGGLTAVNVPTWLWIATVGLLVGAAGRRRVRHRPAAARAEHARVRHRDLRSSSALAHAVRARRAGGRPAAGTRASSTPAG